MDNVRNYKNPAVDEWLTLENDTISGADHRSFLYLSKNNCWVDAWNIVRWELVNVGLTLERSPKPAYTIKNFQSCHDDDFEYRYPKAFYSTIAKWFWTNG